ncbi:hypothetical protein [Mycobacterium uberis]|uniref:hypothetical protein n=1 Tax=Mycobacterium uberis TaxID=2162698 RepID=UPI001FB40C20|nr:hypothetical protein [Mycobacterium uberis]
MPRADKVTYHKAHPQVNLNLDFNGDSGGIIVVGGTAAVVATDIDSCTDEPY